ncbi:MAG: DUF2924 domain-containing protein [Afipia sp.]|nr:DUF2924 domain-containing protein [Afipia sp.]
MKRDPTVKRSISTKSPTERAADKTLTRLVAMPIVELRVLYREVYRDDPPPAYGPDLVRRSIAHRHQEKISGGLSRPAQSMLGSMTKTMMAKPTGRLELPRHIKPGSELVRTWKGTTHRVQVKADGFAYDGRPYASLSEIASHITGTNWNGPRFFGLRPKQEEAPGNGK